MMKKNETLKWDFHRIYFWLFCFALAVIILACFSGIRFVQGEGKCVPPCIDYKECCSGECVDLQTNEEHCGNCNIVCATSETCCDGKCVDLNFDNANCGRCGHSCLGKLDSTWCEDNYFYSKKKKSICDSGTCVDEIIMGMCEEGEICDDEKGCTRQKSSTPGTSPAPQTLTIDIARFVRNTVAFADLGSMAGTWLDKTLGISFFSTPFWGKLEKTWPEGAQIFGGNWESSFCRKLWCVNLDSSGISGAKGAIGSHIEGEKLKISPELNLYKITFALNPTTESLTKQMNFTIELYDNSGNKEYLDLNNDKKPDTWINIKNKYATSKTNPIAFYSKKDYQKICLRFFNTNDYIKELRFALISNSNQLCNNFFDGDPSQNNMNINFGEIEFGGEVNGCANC